MTPARTRRASITAVVLSAVTSPSYLPGAGWFHRTHGRAPEEPGGSPVTGKDVYRSARADGTRAAMRGWDRGLVQAGRKSRAARTSSASLARCASAVTALPATEVAKPH
jgi:hypothetical protein